MLAVIVERNKLVGRKVARLLAAVGWQSTIVEEPAQTNDALATASRIVKLYPEAAIGHALEGAAHLMRNDGDGARTALRRALDARWEEGAEAQREQVKRLLDQLGPAGR